ncbi:MAG: cupredoxin domain-containing protein [bacterium]
MGRSVWHAIAVSIVIGTLAGVGAASAAPVTTIKITQKEFSFTPKTVTVAAGPARFVLTNVGAVEHDFTISDLGVQTGMIKPGATVTVPPAGKPPIVLKKGIYQGYCMVPGHKELGMVITIVVK